jgi:hypothetical protein
MQAVGEYIVIEPFSEKEKDGLIVIPDAAKKSMQADCEWTKIVSVGDECGNKDVKPGRHALILMGSCLTIPKNKPSDPDYLLCKYSRVVAVK